MAVCTLTFHASNRNYHIGKNVLEHKPDRSVYRPNGFGEVLLFLYCESLVTIGLRFMKLTQVQTFKDKSKDPNY